MRILWEEVSPASLGHSSEELTINYFLCLLYIMRILWEDVSWSQLRGFPLRLPVRYCFQMAAKPVGPETSIFAGSLGLQDKHQSNIQGHYLCTVKTKLPLLHPVFKGGFFGFFQFSIQHSLICRSSDSTVSEDAGIEPMTVATSALAVRRSNRSAGSHPQLC